MAHEGETPDDGVQQGRILAELEAIFQTPEFERAPVMRRLLAFLVRTTLAGGGDELKAYSVAVDGLGRDADFDSQSDSYPRVQVGRLRKMLDVYYAQVPPSDDVRLFIKPGGYRVHFRKVEPAPSGSASPAGRIAEEITAGGADARSLAGLAGGPAARARRVSPRAIAIGAALAIGAVAALWYLASSLVPGRLTQAPLLELRPIEASDDAQARTLARRIDAFLGYALNRSWIARVAKPDGDAQEGAGAAPRADYILTGQVTAGPGFSGKRLFLTLTGGDARTQIWTETVRLPDDSAVSLFPALRPAIANLIGPFGAIATNRRADVAEDATPGYDCLLNVDRYFRDRDPKLQRIVRACVTETIEREPMNATALAAGSYLEFDWAHGGGTPAAHARGADLARRAVAANPYSADAHAADARVAFVYGQCERGREITDRAIALNPFDPTLLGLLGYLSFQCGDPRAVDMLTTARALDPDLPSFYSIALILGLIEREDTAGAVRIAGTIRPPVRGASGPYLLARVIAEAAQDDLAGAKKAWETLLRIRKVKGTGADEVLAQYLYAPAFRAKVIGYLAQKSVVPGPASPQKLPLTDTSNTTP